MQMQLPRAPPRRTGGMNVKTGRRAIAGDGVIRPRRLRPLPLPRAVARATRPACTASQTGRVDARLGESTVLCSVHYPGSGRCSQRTSAGSPGRRTLPSCSPAASQGASWRLAWPAPRCSRSPGLHRSTGRPWQGRQGHGGRGVDVFRMSRLLSTCPFQPPEQGPARFVSFSSRHRSCCCVPASQPGAPPRSPRSPLPSLVLRVLHGLAMECPARRACPSFPSRNTPALIG
jgi:hypothetical protein